MPNPKELYHKWKKQPPREVDVGDFKKVITHYLGEWLRESTGTSHQLHVVHPALSKHSGFSGFDYFTVAVKSGRRVRGGYVLKLFKAIECIYEYEDRKEELEL